MAKVLSEKQKAFCVNFVAGASPEKAALQAGYSKSSARNAVGRLLSNPLITEEINRLKAEKGDEVTKEYVTGKLLDLLDRCLEAKPVTKWDPSQKKKVETGEYTFDSRGAIKVLEQLTKQLVSEQSGGKDSENKNPVVNIIDDIK